MSRFENTGSYSESTIERKETPAMIGGSQVKPHSFGRDFGFTEEGPPQTRHTRFAYPGQETGGARTLGKLFPVRPDTELQALMEAAPGDEPEPSAEDGAVLREAIADAIDRLDDLERAVFDRITIEQLSVRRVGRELEISKSQVHRIYQDAVVKLQDLLGGHPLIASKLEDPF